MLGLGVDSLTCWSTGPSGWRPADLWLREQYPEIRNSIISPNGLFGSMGLNGMATLVCVRKVHPDLYITETHPKVLYWHLTRDKYDYTSRKTLMDGWMGTCLGLTIEPANEHEWDAAISALAVLESLREEWTRDLHALEGSAEDRLVQPCGRTHYFWPD